MLAKQPSKQRSVEKVVLGLKGYKRRCCVSKRFVKRMLLKRPIVLQKFRWKTPKQEGCGLGVHRLLLAEPEKAAAVAEGRERPGVWSVFVKHLGGSALQEISQEELEDGAT